MQLKYLIIKIVYKYTLNRIPVHANNCSIFDIIAYEHLFVKKNIEHIFATNVCFFRFAVVV